MRRSQILLAGAVAATLAASTLILLVAAGDEDEPTAAPSAPCETPAGHLDPGEDDGTTRPGGQPLVPRVRGHVPIGFNDSSFLVGQLDLDRALRLYGEAGGTISRLPLDWGEVERSPGRYDFSGYDRIYCAMLAQGVRPLWHLTGSPTWAVPAGTCARPPCVRPPESAHLPALQRFAELVAARYPRSAAIEAWNEPNLAAFWGGPPDPAAYVPVLRAIYAGVKAKSPDLPVLGGALSNNPVDDPAGDLSLQTYLEGIVGAGALSSMDALSLHPYPVAPPGTREDLFTPALRTARAALGDSGVRLWITELGAPTAAGGALPAVSPATQAAMLRDIYASLDRSDDVDAVIFHTLVDPPPSVPGGPGYGFFSAPDAAGAVTPKPVVCSLRREIDLPGPCPDEPLAP